MPELTVGTLDNLVALSDDLIKISTQVEVRNSNINTKLFNYNFFF